MYSNRDCTVIIFCVRDVIDGWASSACLPEFWVHPDPDLSRPAGPFGDISPEIPWFHYMALAPCYPPKLTDLTGVEVRDGLSVCIPCSLEGRGAVKGRAPKSPSRTAEECPAHRIGLHIVGDHENNGTSEAAAVAVDVRLG